MNDAFVGMGRLHRPLAPLVLPAVYDDVLSYEEWLSKVVARCNELSEQIDTTLAELKEEVEGIVDARISVYLDQRLTPIQNEIASIQTDITNLETELANSVSDLESQITDGDATLRTYINEQIATVRGYIVEVERRIDGLVAECNEYTDNAIDESQAELRNLIAELNDRIDAIIKEYPHLYNPVTGFYEDMQTLVYNLYKRLRYFGIEAMLYDDQTMTAEEYDDQSITAVAYDTLMKKILAGEIKEMFNPFTGEYESIKDVVTYLIRRLQWNGKTAGEYDGLDTTAEDFDSSTFNAYEQDTNQYVTQPQIDYKNKFFKNFLFEGTVDNINTQLSVIIGDKKQLVFSEYGSPVNVFTDIRSGRIGLPSGATVEMTVSNNTVVIIYEGSDSTTIYSSTDVYDVSELDK